MFLSLPRRLCFRQRCLFVCLFVCLQDYAKTTQPIFTKFGVKMAHGLPKKPLDFGGNPNHVTLGLDPEGRVMVTVSWRHSGYVSPGVCLTVTILLYQRP